ncbi:hypothetical protein [Sediminibacterium sp.]|uniref:hypothetical protein n=1 Tax=Sediminibacterium sp. TaxID=1917865 RepID=UPI002735DFB6|nr:hypothetical protein [Sediminibacterium sp.]MDP3393229.1 hypothetical protein [Sediminibacterium sp.]MDP3567831.1 hypothetical protein [Sediminibacterium sp.]
MSLYKFFLGLALSTSLGVHAQDTAVPSPKKTFKNFINPDSLPLMNLRIVPIPILTSTPETGVRFGGALEYFFNAKEKDSEARGSYIHGQLTYSTLGQFEAKATWQVFTKGEKFVFRGAAGYSTYNDRFWGIGNNTVAENNYLAQDYSRIFLESRTYRLLKNQWYIGLKLDYNDVYNVVNAKPLTPDQNDVPGIYGSKTIGLGPAILYEGRDFPFSAHQGAYAEVYFSKNFSFKNNPYDFNTWFLDLRKYYPLTKNSTLAFQLSSIHTTGNVPLRELPKVGGSVLMRGYFTGRFRDRSFTALQAEYRFHIWRWVYGAAFGSAGLIDDALSSYSTDNLLKAGGLGLRFLVNKKNRMFLRLDYARNSTAGGAYYIRLNEAF